MRKNKKYKKNRRLMQIIMKILILIMLFFIAYFIVKKISDPIIIKNNQKNLVQAEESQIKISESLKDIDKVRVVDRPEANLSIGISVKNVLKTDYMPGTPHNYMAKEYSYPTKDVYNWIFNPGSYQSDEKIVFLTFDDGPDLVNTPKILDILQRNNVHGTFFVVGKACEKEGTSEILKRQIINGHSIGYHSYSHQYSFLYPDGVANTDNILKEIEQVRDIIREKTGLKNFSSTTFRYPGGHMSWKNVSQVDEVLAEKGIYNLDWNALTGDAESPSVGRQNESPLEHIQNDLKSYGYPKVVSVLMHDTKKVNLDYLDEIIRYFKNEGYKFAVLG